MPIERSNLLPVALAAIFCALAMGMIAASGGPVRVLIAMVAGLWVVWGGLLIDAIWRVAAERHGDEEERARWGSPAMPVACITGFIMASFAAGH